MRICPEDHILPPVLLSLIAVAFALSIGCDTDVNKSNNVPLRPQGTVNNIRNPSDVNASSIKLCDITDSCGIDFTPVNGREAGLFSILESLGTGVGILDIDHDSHPDIFFPGGGVFDEEGKPIGRTCGIFRQTRPLRFTDITANADVDTVDVYTHGVLTGDWDSDGFSDIVLTGYNSTRLFRNLGDGTFVEMTREARLMQDAWATSSTFLDADNDGDLDLFVANYVEWKYDEKKQCEVGGHRDICPPGEYPAQGDHFYVNNGDNTFRLATQESGLTKPGKSLAVISGDIDLDGDCDIYVANDTTANFLYINDGTGKFTERGLVSGCALGATALAEGSMGVEMADFDQDGLPDLWVSNYENQSFAMYQSRGPGIFQHVSQVTGISDVGQLYVGFGTIGFDAELDGDIDLFAANGHVMYMTGKAPVRQRPLVYENMGQNHFKNIAAQTGEYGSSAHMGRGVAAEDFDNDGLIDIVVAHTNERVVLLHNQSKPHSNCVTIRPVGLRSNRSGIGLHATQTTSPQSLNTRCGGSYLSSSSTRLHAHRSNNSSFSCNIYWPGGRNQQIFISKINKSFVVVEGIEPFALAR